MTQTLDFDELTICGGLLMVAALALLGYVLRERWSSSMGFLFVLALVMYHGLCEVSLRLFPIGLMYRYVGGMDFRYSGQTVLVAGVGILVFAISYCLGRPTPIVGRDTDPPIRSYAWIFQIRPAVFVPWLIASAIYRAGGNNLLENTGGVGYVLSAILFYVSAPLLALAIVWLSAYHSSGQISNRYYVVSLLCVVLLFSIVSGRRQEIFVVSIASFILLHKFRIKRIEISRLVLPALILMGVFLAMACIRASIGREDLMAASPSERINMVIDGFSEAFTGEHWQQTVDTVTMDLGYRLDGNLFLANVIQAETSNPDRGWDFEPFRLSFLVVIPSFLWPDKNDRDIRDMKSYMTFVRHLPEVDYLQTPLAEFYAVGGVVPMIVCLTMLGVGVAWLEKFVARGIERQSPTSAFSLALGITGICMAVGLMYVEWGIYCWLLMMRNLLVIWVVLQTGGNLLLAVRVEHTK